MIYVVGDGRAVDVVAAGFRRSCSHSAVEILDATDFHLKIEEKKRAVYVLINPSDNIQKIIISALGVAGAKIIFFGSMPRAIVNLLGGSISSWPNNLSHLGSAEQALPGSFSESRIKIEYNSDSFPFPIPIKRRALIRYDYSNEWNNLFYGQIRTDGTIWSVGSCISFRADNCFASICLEGDTIATYAARWITEFPADVLWFNRAVGPVDSHEWRIVECFVSRSAYSHFSQPILIETPFGQPATVTMRLDCDEDIESARTLFCQYVQAGVPFSMALTTKNLIDERNLTLPREVIDAGGALLAHSYSHAANWGGSYDAACFEAEKSRQDIENSIGIRVDYAVAPFHHAPVFARRALADVGFLGCIGGIIANDPDFLLGRAGQAVDDPSGFITHSQQCMLHGDCMPSGHDKLVVYRDAFEVAKTTRSIFGYLDHPFSERYSYGWLDEATRCGFHNRFLSELKQSQAIFLNEAEVLNHIHDKSMVDVIEHDSQFHIVRQSSRSHFSVAIEYNGTDYALPICGAVMIGKNA